MDALKTPASAYPIPYPILPEPHFPSPYEPPHARLAWAKQVHLPDGARIATYVYVSGNSRQDIPKSASGSAESGLSSVSTAESPGADLSSALTPESPNVHPSFASTAESPDAQTPSAPTSPIPADLPEEPLPLLVLHGNGEEHRIFGPIIDAVCESGRSVIAIDSRAQGASTRGTASLSYELMAKDALAALDALGIAKAHLLGFSDGAIEALLIARDHPDRTASLLSIGANLTPDGAQDSDGFMKRGSQTLRSWACYWSENGASSEGPQTAGADLTTEVDRALLSPTPDRALQEAELLELMMKEPHIDPESLSGITCPSCIMAGEFDLIRSSQTLSIASAIPGAKLIIVPDAGHSLPKRRPAIVIQAALDTIRRANVSR